MLCFRNVTTTFEKATFEVQISAAKLKVCFRKIIAKLLIAVECFPLLI